MALTEQEKKDIKKDVLDAIKAESTDVKELEVATTLNGLTGLPAMQGEKLVTAPLSLLSKPATDAAAVAKSAAQKAEQSAGIADTAAATAREAAGVANNAAQTANAAAEAADKAAANITAYDDRIKTALKGATARFDGMIDTASIVLASSVLPNGKVIYVKNNKVFAYFVGGKYYNNWSAEGITPADMFMDSTQKEILKDKVYLFGGAMYVWSDDEGNLVEFSGSGSGSGFYNVTNEQPLSS